MPIDPQDGGLDDWIAPRQSANGANHPDDWIAPTAGPPAASSAAWPAPSLQSNMASPASSDLPAAPEDPFAAYWAMIPASRADALAWYPSIFPNSLGQFPSPGAGPLNTLRIDTTQGPLGVPPPVLSGADFGNGNPSTSPLSSAAAADVMAPLSDQVSAGSEGNSHVDIGDDQPNPADLVDQTPDPETGLTQAQTEALAELYRGALSSVGRFVRAHDPQLARLPIDLADMAHDAVTDFPEFLRRAEPGLAGLGLSAPMTRASGNVWLLNDLLRGRIAEMVHGRNLPYSFQTVDKFVDGIVTSTKSINLNAPYYQNAKALYSKLRGQINNVANFIGGTREGVTIKESEIAGRALDVLVPHTGSVAQKSAIKQAIEYGAQQGVTVNIIRHQ